MIKIKNGKVKNNGKTYVIGDTLSGLSEKDEATLISLGLAEQVPVEKKNKEVNIYDGKNVEEMTAIIESMESEDELKAVFEFEQKGKNRKTVFQAIEAKMEAINNEDHDSDSQDNDGSQDDNSEDEDPNTNLDINFNPAEMLK